MRNGSLIALGLAALGGAAWLAAGASVQVKKKYNLAELEQLAAWAGFKGQDATHAAQLAMRESGGRPDAVNDTRGRTDLPKGTTNEYSVGLWQINTLSSPQWSDRWLKNPLNNAKAAYQLFKSSGWKPWRLPNTEGES